MISIAPASVRGLLVAALALALAACAPAVEGPQLMRVPDGLGLDVNCEAARLLLPRERERGQRCYVTLPESSEGGVITRFEGPTSPDDLWQTLAGYAAHWEGHAGSRFGSPTTLRMDGRHALGIFEETPTRLALRALVSHDDETYSVEVWAGSGPLKSRDALQDVVESFAGDPGRRARLLTPLAFVMGIVVLAAFAVRLRGSRERTAPPVVAGATRPVPAPAAAARR